MPASSDPRVDAYIAKSGAFAQPILKHLRAVVHRALPDVQEDIKWSAPFFIRNGKIVGMMAAFKAHCAFGFWHQQMEKELGAQAKGDEAMGLLGRLTSVADLPDDKTLVRYVQRAAELNESDIPARPRPATNKAKKELAVPADLAAALKKNKQAATTFAGFSPSHRKEYIEWITEAKREETRQKRLATTLEQLAEGKALRWKYEKC